MRDRFGNHCNIISGYAFKSTDLLEEADIPVIKIGNISNCDDVIIDDSTQYVTSDFLEINEKYHIKNGDILISLTGSHINQPNSMVGRTCRNYSDTVYLLNQRAGKVIVKKNTDKDYIYYLFMLRAIKEGIVTRAYGAANQVNISPTAIENMKWEFPDITTQIIIGEILSSYDKCIVNNNKRIKILEQMAENLYKEWFVRFRFPGHEDVEFEAGIPKSWEVYKLKDLCYINAYSIGKKDDIEIINYLDTGSLTENIIESTVEYSLEEAPSRAKRKVKMNSILFSTVRPMLKHYGILKQLEKNMIVSTGFAVIDAKYDISNILYLFISSTEVRNYCQTIAEGAVATYPTIRPEEIENIRIAMPKLEVAEKWNNFFEPYFQMRQKLMEENINLIKQRDLLIPRLMSGKLQVKK